MRFFLITILACCIMSCQSAQKADKSAAHEKVVSLRQKLEKRDKMLERLRAENIALAAKNTESFKKTKLPVQKKAKKYFAPPESELFVDIKSAYDSGESKKLFSLARRYLLAYPNGKNVDLVHYFVGYTFFLSKKYSNAIFHFSQIEKKYPKSSKLTPSLFGKAMAYKELKLFNQSIGLLEEISNKHANTIEAKWAQSEMMLTQKLKIKR